jgi:hypothetical protein
VGDAERLHHAYSQLVPILTEPFRFFVVKQAATTNAIWCMPVAATDAGALTTCNAAVKLADTATIKFSCVAGGDAEGCAKLVADGDATLTTQGGACRIPSCMPTLVPYTCFEQAAVGMHAHFGCHPPLLSLSAAGAAMLTAFETHKLEPFASGEPQHLAVRLRSEQWHRPACTGCVSAAACFQPTVICLMSQRTTSWQALRMVLHTTQWLL